MAEWLARRLRCRASIVRFPPALIAYALIATIASGCAPGPSPSDARVDDAAAFDASEGGSTMDARDVVAPSDVPADEVASDAGCSTLGTYTATLAGRTIYFRFGDAGRYAAATSVAELDTAPFNTGTYAFDTTSSTLTFTQDTFCSAAVGSYRVTFGVSCSTLTLMLLSDTCPGRGRDSDGLVATRV